MKKQLFLIVILILTILTFSNSLTNGFTGGDDDLNFTHNSYIQHLSFNNIKVLFTTSFADRYTPMTMLIYALTYQINGLSPFVFHLLSLTLHLLNILLVYILIWKLSKNQPVASVTALLFAIHPNVSEAVAWASDGNTLLYTFFFLNALIFYYYFLQKRQWMFYFFTAVFCLLSLLSKPTAISLPFVLLLMDFYDSEFKVVSKVLVWKWLLEKLPFVIMSAVFGIVALSFGGKNHITDYQTTYNLLDRLFLASFIIASFALKIVLPYHTAVFNVFPPKINGWLPLAYYLSAVPVLSTLIFALAFKKVTKIKLSKEIIFGLGFFLITIFPVLEIIPKGDPDFMGERYSYLPYLGLFFLISFIGVNLYQKFPKAKKALKTVLLVYVLIYSVLAWNLNTTWVNSISLWSSIIKTDPQNYEGYYGMGNTKQDLGDLQGALKAYNQAVAINPGFSAAFNERGIAKRRLGDLAGALKDYNQAIKLRPNYAKAYFNRAMLKKQLGKSPQDILADLNKASDYDRQFPGIFYERGKLLLSLPSVVAACGDFKRASKLGFAPAVTMLDKFCR